MIDGKLCTYRFLLYIQKNNMKKLLTIGIPNFNGEKYLRDTILSCQNIDLSIDEYEILVIDNVSTDNSVGLIRELQRTITNLRLEVNEENYGRIGNWNRIIELADSDFLIFLMNKDRILPIQIRNHLLHRRNMPYEHYVFQSGFIKDGKNIPTPSRWYTYNIPIRPQYIVDEKIAYFSQKKNFISLTTNIFSVSLLHQFRLRFDTKFSYMADEKFLLQYYLRMHTVTALPDQLYTFNRYVQDRFGNANISELYFDAVQLHDFYYHDVLCVSYHRMRANILLYLHMVSVCIIGKVKSWIGHTDIPYIPFVDTKRFFLTFIGRRYIFGILLCVFIPLYVIYYILNVHFHFRFFIKFQ